MAAGLSLRRDALEAFQEAFDQEVRRHLSEADLQGVVHSDGELEPGYLDLATAESLRRGGPWGKGFPEPIFDGWFRVLSRRTLGGGAHLKMMLVPASAVGRMPIEAIAFRYEQEPPPQDARVRLVFRLNVNEYQGRRRPQLMVEHVFFEHG